MNIHAIRAIYRFEMARLKRTVLQSVISPVISTSLFFVVFGSAIGANIDQIDGIDYAAFLVPGLTMLTVLQQSIMNGAFGIYFPRFIGTVYELLSAPVSPWEALVGYVGAAASKSLLIGAVILLTATLFVDLRVEHPLVMALFLFLTATSFSLLGFILGIWAKSFEQLNLVPMLLITPLVFLGGSFYSIEMLPEPWRTVSLFNPVLYLVSGFRWSFYGVADVSVWASLGMILAFMAICLVIVWRIFKTGYRLRA